MTASASFLQPFLFLVILLTLATCQIFLLSWFGSILCGMVRSGWWRYAWRISAGHFVLTLGLLLVAYGLGEYGWDHPEQTEDVIAKMIPFMRSLELTCQPMWSLTGMPMWGLGLGADLPEKFGIGYWLMNNAFWGCIGGVVAVVVRRTVLRRVQHC